MAPYDNSLWFVETNTHPLLSAASAATAGTRHGRPDMVNYIRPSFWSRFWELQRVMWETNAALTERHAYDSRPSTWPTLRRGINFWTKDHRQVYLMGNPFIWYASLCAVMVYAGARILLMLRAKRGFRDFQDSTIVFYDQTAGFLTLGWAMHFLPFFAMSRQLFVHHYLPALYFSILVLAVLFDVVTAGLRPKFRLMAALALVSIAFASYSTYAPLAYASPWTQRACERSRLLKTWDFNCREFPQHRSDYANFGPGIHTAPGLMPNLGVPAPAATHTQIEQAPAAQAGNHPFENVPKKAAPSGKGYDPLPEGVEGGNLGSSDENVLNVPPAGVPDGVAGVERPPSAGDTEPAKAGDAAAPLASGANDGDGSGRVEGLDQEGMEAIVLGGTADKAPARSQFSNGAARESVAAVASTEDAAAAADDGEVRIGHEV